MGGALYGADLVTECMKKKKNTNKFRFRFRPKMEFRFRRHFRLRPKMKNDFRSASSMYHKKVLFLVLRCKVLVLVLKKSLDYITGV